MCNDKKNPNSEQNEEIVHKAFDELSPKKDDKIILFPQRNHSEKSFHSEEPPASSQEEWDKAMQDYIPSSVGDTQWEDFASRTPIPLLDREQEYWTVAIGLQEMKKTKAYMHYIYRHMTNEFKRLYVTYPLLFEKSFEEHFGQTHKAIEKVMEDMEHLMTGDIDHISSVKEDSRLYQSFEEKRTSLLHDILDYYDKKK